KLTINGKSFRESIMAQPGQQSWLTSDILVNTLATLDGRFSKAALSAELTKDGLKKYTNAQIEAKIATARTALEQKNGVKYTDEQFKALQKLSDASFKSATEVKTLGQVFDVAKETIGSGWGASFQSIFGNLTEAKKTFTELSGAINGVINANALARNKMLHDWKQLGGRTDLIEGIKNIFKALGSVIKPIKDAFRDIFPAKTGKDLADLTQKFRDFTEKLKIGPETADALKRTFAGFFAVLDIGKRIVGGILGVIGDLFGAASDGSGGFLGLTAGIGDFLVSVDKAIKRGDGLKNFFHGLSAVLQAPIKLLARLSEAITHLFSGGKSSEGVSKQFGSLKDSLSPLTKVVDASKRAWDGFLGVLGRIGKALKPVFGDLVGVVADTVNSLADAFAHADMDRVFEVIQTTLVGGIFLTLRRALTGGLKGEVNIDLGGKFLKPLAASLDIVNKSLSAIQKNIQADTLRKIAIAMGILAAAIAALSLIDPGKLSKAMTAVSVGFGQLVGAMALLTKTSGGGGGPKAMLASAAQMAIISSSLIALAGAVLVLSLAVKLMSTMSWDELHKGLAGVAGALAAIAIATK
ncbi:MAG TPA: hypothetical protein VN843_10440, partial [Anaerolineales bacterium]|nr:hypothetical protein [Anaerolineales bacterium]